MYAVVDTGGKQHKIREGDVIHVDKLDAAAGDAVVFERVLMVAGDSGVKVGTPVVEGAKVTAEVVDQGRHRKILVFKYKPKKNYRKRYGHRQPFTKLKITKIEG